VHGQVAVESLSRQLLERDRHVREIAGTYEETQTPSEAFVRAYARDTNSSRPLDQVKAQFTRRSAVNFAEANPLYRYWERIDYDDAGKKQNHSIRSHDGKEHWQLRQIPSPEELRAAQVDVGESILEDYDGNMPLRLLMGRVVPGFGKPLSAYLFEQGAVIDGPAQWLESRCYRARVVQQVPEGWLRRTYWLDADRGLCMRQHNIETSPTGTDWLMSETWSIPEIAESNLKGIYYPVRSTRRVFNQDKVETFVHELRVNRLTVNPGLPVSTYTPTIEAGSNVTDKRTGKTIVWGDHPSERIMRLLTARIAESRKALDDGTTPAAPHVQSAMPPTSMWRYVSWLIGAAGISCLVCALVIGLRRRRT
jgi:hypothetical protein